jgi:hypothetical protein
VAGASSTQTAALCQRPDDHSKTDFFNTIGAQQAFARGGTSVSNAPIVLKKSGVAGAGLC